MATIYGNAASSYWKTMLIYSVDNNYSNTHSKITYTFGVYFTKKLDYAYTRSYDRPSKVSCTGQSDRTYTPTGNIAKGTGAGNHTYYAQNATFTIPKTVENQTIYLTASIKHTNQNASGTKVYNGTSTAKVGITVTALPKYTVSFNPKGGYGEPQGITISHGVATSLPISVPIKDGYSFTAWNSLEDYSGTDYLAGTSYTGTSNATLYAKWGAADPPEVTHTDPSITVSNNGSITRGFSTISVTVSDTTYIHHGRQIASLKLQAVTPNNTYSTTLNQSTGTLTIDTSSWTNADDGNVTLYLIVTDDADGGGASTAYTYNIDCVAPTWQKELTISQPIPQTDSNGNAILDTLEVYRYRNGTVGYEYVSTSDYHLTDKTVGGSPAWSITYIFDEDHVDDPTSTTPSIKVRATYKHYDVEVPDGNRAFFTTSRNQNFSNGIYNLMFVGGVDNEQFTDYTSRVWWCEYNNPLYFPDTYYTEVGSNDTAIQGLTKVGDYLAVIKQSKTTDTAIFLLYPTSFDTDTTFAVKQGVQGVGALSRYSFNILGDETLFLSPKGVMAIVPTDDEEHKVQNRSYFIDKRLLNDSEVANSYSFAFDGKYFLATGNGVGSVYVLDGNQRNSWGNDKTVLVYECYYLENVPAKCFVKYNDRLAFSDSENVCIFGDSFIDAYDCTTNDKQVSVKAKWSTIFDDDGALHYYKTMQKKGNLVSVLPLENEIFFVEVVVDEETFNNNKTAYYQFIDDTFVPCTEDTQYNSGTQYYMEHHSATEVWVKKDDNDPVLIERSFGRSSNIPSEMFLNKKFKKYKRLQFILKNESSEDFGVDEIVKNYTVGNYAKK